MANIASAIPERSSASRIKAAVILRHGAINQFSKLRGVISRISSRLYNRWSEAILSHLPGSGGDQPGEE